MIEPQAELAEVLSEGRRQFLAGRLDLAVAAYKNAVDSVPDDFMVQRSAGILFLQNKDYQGAAKHLLNALRLNEFDTLTLQGLTQALSSLPSGGCQLPDGRQQSSLAKSGALFVIYDLEANPCSIGDFLNFLQGAVVVADMYGAQTMDICFVSNPNNPTTSDLIDLFSNDSRFCHLFSILPITQLAGRIGSILIVESLVEALGNLGKGYLALWPNAAQLQCKGYMFYEIMKLCHAYKQHHGDMPRLSCRKSALSWAKGFHDAQVSPEILVSVNIRNNPKYATHRNSSLEAWLRFFEDCIGKYPVKFVVICGTAEVDDRFRQLGNVLFAKDFSTDIEQDLALIEFSAMHLGSASGPATMATFTKKPYLIVNADMGNYIEHYDGALISESGMLHLGFSEQNQRFGTVPETFEYLADEFKGMWDQLDLSIWHSFMKNIVSSNAPLTWLR
ncbi:MAG: hypothetical protein A2075_21555 [Geobacteraceae bacterium GWC2_58_44]|nr:MAG: hypothetical protein A2075_21555 [Geobacteraceae bacterium GWC2_58_44]